MMNRLWKYGFTLMVCWIWGSATQASGISIQFDPSHYGQPAIKIAVADVVELLKSAFPFEIGTTNPNADILIVLPPIDLARQSQPTRWEKEATFPYFHVAPADFKWIASRQGKQRVLKLEAISPKGVANGLYALLQEKLGFSFYHPRETIIPHWEEWPLPDDWTLEGHPGFDKMGFHLHTQHPLELTEALHNHTFGEAGIEKLDEFFRWLARNGQNYFEFCLLEGIDLVLWPYYAGQFCARAKARGILCGVDVSLHMFQQKAFQLVRFPPKSFRNFEKQISDRVDRLMYAQWDFISVDFAIGEFVGGLENLRVRLKKSVVEKLAQDYPKTKLFERQHVIKPGNEIGGSHGTRPETDTTNSKRGILVHTVMGYGVDWEKAPVYESDNLQHMLPILHAQRKVRETWFYPESAYWITFDNSVPIFFLPYLQARYDDIQLMKKWNIPGHLTFSSGWEWGYWLVDWSIMRWSWDYVADGKNVEQSPTSSLRKLPDYNHYIPAVEKALEVEMEYLVDREGMKLLTASTMTDELPFGLNRQFLPRPDFTYQWLTREATAAQVDSIEQVVSVLQEFREALNEALGPEPEKGEEYPYAPVNQLVRALEVTETRAAFRTQIFAAMIADARKRLKQETPKKSEYLEEAESLRQIGIEQVRGMEQIYRYPIEDIAGRHRSYTAYTFGYLWTTHDLHLWEREIVQTRRGRWSPLARNIWDAFTIVGLRD